jgi:hypothetical protein
VRYHLDDFFFPVSFVAAYSIGEYLRDGVVGLCTLLLWVLVCSTFGYHLLDNWREAYFDLLEELWKARPAMPSLYMGLDAWEDEFRDAINDARDADGK